MAGYLILGAGRFGRLALQRLSRQDAAAAFLVVDCEPAALAAAQALKIPRMETVSAEAVAFLAAHLKADLPWDWLLPMVPVHVAWAWLRAGPLHTWQPVPAPAGLEAAALVAWRGPEGQLYLSRATHRCPDDCPEPEVCPVSGESRGLPLCEALAAWQLPGWVIKVVTSRQLAPGVGGYPPGELLNLARELTGKGGRVLIATACRCHGVVQGLRNPENHGNF